MIRVTAEAAALVHRLRERATRLAAAHVAARGKRSRQRRADWHSAAALWPDFTGDSSDGK
jgi:hypothetical protein